VISKIAIVGLSGWNGVFAAFDDAGKTRAREVETAAFAALATQVATLMAVLNAKIRTLANLAAKIAKKILIQCLIFVYSAFEFKLI
jgi:hypothetical protein